MNVELLFCWVAGQLSVLVPKKRGSGFLRVIYGHHHNQALTEIANAAQSDVFGLDGALDFVCGGKVYHGGASIRAEYAEKIIPRLE